MHMVIQNKIYKKGTVWIRYDDYLNFSWIIFQNNQTTRLI
jgi:hypothetical protein